jgi:hypothetical protein
MDINQPDVDPDAHREELIADAEEMQADEDAEKAALLAAVKNDEEFTHGQTEWVELGDVDLRVKAYFPGDTLDTVRQFSQAEEDSVPDFGGLVDALISVTEVVRTEGVTWESDEQVAEFWRAYYSEHGTNVLLVATERVFAPAVDNMEERTPQSFRQ